MITLILFSCLGYCIHALRKFDSWRLERINYTFYSYIAENWLHMLISLLCTMSLTLGGILDGINWQTAIALGYSGDNFFRYLIDRKKNI